MFNIVNDKQTTDELIKMSIFSSWWNRFVRVLSHWSYNTVFLRDSRASEMRARVKITPRHSRPYCLRVWECSCNLSPLHAQRSSGSRLEKGFLAWGDFHAFAFRSLYYPWGTMGTTRSLGREVMESESEMMGTLGIDWAIIRTYMLVSARTRTLLNT